MPTAPQTRIRIVQSRANARVKELRAALTRPGGGPPVGSVGLVGLEGLHLLEEALRSGAEARTIRVQTIFVRAGAESLLDSLDLSSREPAPEILSIPADVLRSAVTTEAPQAIAALVVPPAFTLEDCLGVPGYQRQPALVLVLAGVQDPGNVGAIVRSAEAFGASGVLVLPGTASVWNAKSLRASMGSAFRLPVVATSAAEAFKALRARGIVSLAAVAPGHAQAQAQTRSITATGLGTPVALWIGNEGSGLSSEMIDSCDGAVTIPCPGPVESLNAAIAASVLLYEASRQRAGPLPQNVHPRPA
jgi:TrmH family RNA methyltransferase